MLDVRDIDHMLYREDTILPRGIRSVCLPRADEIIKAHQMLDNDYTIVFKSVSTGAFRTVVVVRIEDPANKCGIWKILDNNVLDGVDKPYESRRWVQGV